MTRAEEQEYLDAAADLHRKWEILSRYTDELFDLAKSVATAGADGGDCQIDDIQHCREGAIRLTSKIQKELEHA